MKTYYVGITLKADNSLASVSWDIYEASEVGRYSSSLALAAKGGISRRGNTDSRLFIDDGYGSKRSRRYHLPKR